MTSTSASTESLLRPSSGNAGLPPDVVRETLRVTWWGLAVNLVLFAVKLAAGLVGNSRTMVADAVHTLSDLSTDVAVLVGVRFWSRPPDASHPYGHWRIETLVTSAIGLALAVVAVGIGWDAIASLREEHLSRPRGMAFWAALLSIVTKEALYRWTIHVGRRVNSPAVVANAWHHRSDALSSIPAAFAVLGAWVLPSWSVLDHVGAVGVALFILAAAVKIVRPALQELVDAGVSDRETAQIHEVAAATPGVVEAHAVRTRISGTRVQVDLHVLVDGRLTVCEGHRIAAQVRQRLLDRMPRIMDVVVHVEPDAHPAHDGEEARNPKGTPV